MSCVALAKAIIINKASEAWSQKAVGKVNATIAKAAPIKNCIVTIHQRLVFILSTKGLHNGFITQGMPSQPV